MRKDRLECQELGMEQLVGLTDPEVCGGQICLLVCIQVLQEPWLLDYIYETGDEGQGNGVAIISACASSLGGDSACRSEPARNRMAEEEARHEGKMRGAALRALTNALSLASNRKLLQGVLKSQKTPLISRRLLDTLVQDLKGAARPPSLVLAGTKLSSAHEASLALRCLRILGEHSEVCRQYLQNDFVLERLERARTCGRSMHLFLQQEAEKTYAELTEDARSC